MCHKRTKIIHTVDYFRSEAEVQATFLYGAAIRKIKQRNESRRAPPKCKFGHIELNWPPARRQPRAHATADVNRNTRVFRGDWTSNGRTIEIVLDRFTFSCNIQHIVILGRSELRFVRKIVVTHCGTAIFRKLWIFHVLDSFFFK